MKYSKKYKNGLKLVINKIEGLLSVSCGILVKTGSSNETEKENGISHFIEHNLFKGTTSRSAFEISDAIDSIGGQINAFTSKELTCYYTKSTSEHVETSLEVLSDIFFNSVFDKKEMDKEKQVIIEEINMTNDSPEDLCLDLLSTAYYGKNGYGRTILGSEKNVLSFDKDAVKNYMKKYYSADNVCISIAGNVDVEQAVKLVDKYFANNFENQKGAKQKSQNKYKFDKLYKYKKTEQSHVALAFSAFSSSDENSIPLSVLSTIFGGGMSSRLFQKIREELGLAYSVYSYPSQYKDNGILEIYAGVGNNVRDKAFGAIINEIENMQKNGVTEKEFMRGKAQMKSSFVLGQESTSSQMLIHGKYFLFLDEEFDFATRINQIDAVKLETINEIASKVLRLDNFASASIGVNKSPLLF